MRILSRAYDSLLLLAIAIGLPRLDRRLMSMRLTISKRKVASIHDVESDLQWHLVYAGSGEVFDARKAGRKAVS